MEGLVIRKLADTSEGRREKRYDPHTGESYLVDPDVAGFDGADPSTWIPSPWPLAGIAFEGQPPKETKVSTAFVRKGKAEGWLELEGEEVVHRPAGPEEEPWKGTHTFLQAEALVFKTVDGAVRYRVTRQPDKYKAGEPGEFPGDPDAEVHWSYRLERADG